MMVCFDYVRRLIKRMRQILLFWPQIRVLMPYQHYLRRRNVGTAKHQRAKFNKKSSETCPFDVYDEMASALYRVQRCLGRLRSKFAQIHPTSSQQRLQISLLGSFKERQRLKIQGIAFFICFSGDDHRLVDSNDRKHSNQPTFLHGLFGWYHPRNDVAAYECDTAFFLPMMTDIFRMSMNELKRMRLFGLKLSKYSPSGDQIPIRISFRKVDLTIYGHHERHNDIDALNNKPESSLDPNGYGDMRHACRFGL